jgi:hypothetical protein
MGWSSYFVQSEIGEQDWATCCTNADQQYGQPGGLRKNILHIGAALKLAWDDNKHSPSLERLCAEILEPSTNSVPA